MLYKKKKFLFTTIAALGLFCGSFFAGDVVDVFAAENCAVEEQLQRRSAQPEDLLFLSYCDNDTLSVWDETIAPLSEEQVQEIKSYMEENIVKSGMTDYEKAQSIFIWLSENITYADDTVVISASPYDVFRDRIAVCGGFSNLYKAMLNIADIPAVVLVGNTTSGAHAWNAVYADNRWFYADTTWGTVNGTKWFDMSTEEFNSSHGTLRISSAAVTSGDVLIGYDGGISVIGAVNGVTTVTVPEQFKGGRLTRISYQLFADEFGVEVVNVGKNIEWIDTQQYSRTLQAINVSADNAYYASKDGVLFTKDMSSILKYPSGKTSTAFVIPKETEGIDFKDSFENSYLKNLQVEDGNTTYAAEKGLLYNQDKSILLYVPAGQTDVTVLPDAAIDELAFVSLNKNNITIYSEFGSPAHQYALENDINFAETKAEVQMPFLDVVEGKYYYDAVTWAVSNNITNGRTETAFCPDEPCTRAQVVTFLWRAAGEPEPTGTGKQFSDVDAKKYKHFYKAIIWAAEQGITKGYPGGTFQPDRYVTRAEFVTFQYRAWESPEIGVVENPFVDVTSAHKNFKNGILWAYQNKITVGKDATHFRPDVICSRGDVVTFLYRGCEI